jgi:hypothetical protein
MMRRYILAAGVVVLALFVFWAWPGKPPEKLPEEPEAASGITVIRLDVESTDSLPVVLCGEFAARADAGVALDDRRLTVAAPLAKALEVGKSLAGVRLQEGLGGLDEARVMVWTSLQYRGEGRYGVRDFFWFGRSLDGFQAPLSAAQPSSPGPDGVFEVVPWPQLEITSGGAGALALNGHALARGQTAEPLTIKVTRDVSHEEWKPVPKQADASTAFPETETVVWRDVTFRTTVRVTNMGVRVLEGGP